MNVIETLRKREREIMREIKAICDATNTRDNAAFTEAEHDKIKTLRAEQRSIGESIAVHEEVIRDSKPKGSSAATDPSMNTRAGSEAAEEEEKRAGFKNEPPSPFKSLGDQLRSVYLLATGRGTEAQRERAREGFAKLDQWHRQERAALGLSEAVDSDGGYLIEPQYVSTLMQRAYDESDIAQRCAKIGLTSSNRIKIPGMVDDKFTDGNRWGGIQVFWGNEADTVAPTKPKFRMIDMSLEKLMGFCYATDEELEDIGALAGVIQQVFGLEFGFVLDNAILFGDGQGKPQGMMNSPAMIQVTPSNASALPPTFADITNMRSRLYAKGRKNAVWLINQDVEPGLIQMQFSPGSSTPIPVWLPANSAAGEPYDRLFNIPVIPIMQAQTVGTPGDITLCDFSQYLLIDKNGMQADSSMHVQFLTAQQVFRFQYRVNGQSTWETYITPKNGSNTTSPWVSLGTRT